MRYAAFKNHKIQKTCKEKFDDEGKYRPFLKKDFSDRCCYCNMPRGLVTTPYHIEHFIPKKAFEGKKDSLKTDYQNLMWACPKCNLSKGDKYKGDLEHDDRIVNELFYNPETTDYNDIFYRNELGGIDSEDSKGREMIRLLKLYRPIHNLAWLVERLELLYDRIEDMEKRETDIGRRELLEKIKGKVSNEYIKKERMFRAAYNGMKVFKADTEWGREESSHQRDL